MTADVLPAMVTVFHGDNRLEINERIDAARSAIDPTGLSTSLFEQASVVSDEVGSAVGSPGFFGAERLVICHNLITPATGSRRRSSSRSKDASDPLRVLGSIAPGVRVIVVENSLKATDERRLRKIASDVAVERLDVPRGRALIDWTCERARVHGAAIDGAVATRLVEALFPVNWREVARRDDVPPDLYRLDTELSKLAIAAGSDVEITADLVVSLVENADALDIWGLSNAIADRDQARAIKQLELAIESGQAPEMILGQLVAQFETFAVVNAARGQAPKQVAAKTGLSEGRLRQAARAARGLSRADVASALCEIRDTDFGIKQGLVEPEDGLVALIAGLAKRRTGVTTG